MAAAVTNSSTFPYFSSLPAELRNRIWHDALPDKDGPALSFYKKGCWCPRRLSKFDEGYDADDKCNLEFEFRHDLVDHIQVEVPLVFVNREARGIALAWVREWGIEICFRKDRQCHVFVRPFDPVYDALYIAFDKWNDFCCEPYDRLFQSDLFGQIVNVTGPDLTRIAVPEALLRSEVATLSEIFEWFFRLAVIFIIVDAQPHLQLENDNMVHRRRELESTQGRAFFWKDDRGGFDLGDGEYIGDEALYRRIEEANKGLGERLAEYHIRSFEIRPVFAVRR